MLFTILVLLLVPLLSGLLIFLLPKGKQANFKLLLAFAGSYLFSITVIHILPELYRQSDAVELIGLFVLIGFFLQQVLEYFTVGIEHGHMHVHHHPHTGTVNLTHRTMSAIVLLMALCVHAFLEGAVLTEHAVTTGNFDRKAILLGIVLHRAPAAFALMAVLSAQLHSKTRAVPYLVVFAVAAPLGLLVSSLLSDQTWFNGTGVTILYAVVSGNFLHISTTIVFESSPEHAFNGKRLAVAVLGAIAAVAVEFMI